MTKMRKLALTALIAGAGIFTIQRASAWWGGDRWRDNDWWDRPGYWGGPGWGGGPHGWGGPYGWGGGPYGWGGGPYGWGGYPGYGYGHAPAANTQQSTTPAPRYPE